MLSRFSGGDSAWARKLHSLYSEVYRYSYIEQNGFSIRCVEYTPGCTEPCLENYNPDANVDDSSLYNPVVSSNVPDTFTLNLEVTDSLGCIVNDSVNTAQSSFPPIQRFILK